MYGTQPGAPYGTQPTGAPYGAPWPGGQQPAQPTATGQPWGQQADQQWPVQPRPIGSYRDPAWSPPQPPAVKQRLPIEPRRYSDFFRTPTYRWWKSLLAVLMGALLFVLANVVVAFPVILYELATGVRTQEELNSGQFRVTPLLFAANNVAIALSIPVAMLTMWACFGMRPRWLSSIVGGLRWGLLGKLLAVCLVPYAILTGIQLYVGWSELTWGSSSLFMILAIAITTPFQAAGEEYGLRGLYNRAVAAWLPNRLLGALVGGLVSTVIFVLLHGAGDPWLNLFYFLFGAVACRLAYATGGLEAPIVLHVVNNLTSELSLPFVDISDMFNREAGTASFAMLLPQLVVIAVAWGLMELVAWRSRVVKEAAPGAVAVAAG